jgi:multidrug resistance efflux pump
MTEPVSVKRFVQELEKLKQEMDAGRLKHGEYDQRLARMIQELRDRKLDADRAEITAALEEALRRGVITRSVRDHLMKRLGLS